MSDPRATILWQQHHDRAERQFLDNKFVKAEGNVRNALMQATKNGDMLQQSKSMMLLHKIQAATTNPKATETLEQAFALTESAIPEDTEDFADLLIRLAISAEQQSQFDKAEKLWHRVVHILKQTDDSETLYFALDSLTDTHMSQGQYHKAHSSALELISLVKNWYGADSVEVGREIERFREILNELGEKTEADLLLKFQKGVAQFTEETDQICKKVDAALHSANTSVQIDTFRQVMGEFWEWFKKEASKIREDDPFREYKLRDLKEQYFWAKHNLARFLHFSGKKDEAAILIDELLQEDSRRDPYDRERLLICGDENPDLARELERARLNARQNRNQGPVNSNVNQQESVVEKIKKLLALADGNQNENEREVAMRFAMELLSKHNLTLSELETGLTNLKTIQRDGDIRLEAWVRPILKAACVLYYSEFFISRRYDCHHRRFDVPVFIGTAENVAVTIDVATWLIDSVRRESNRTYKDASDRRSFRLGAADRIVERAYELVAAEKQSDGAATGTSLVLIRNQLQQANQAHLATLNLRPFKPRTKYVNSDAYADGEAYGNEVRLKGSEHQSRSTVKALLPDLSPATKGWS